MLNCKRVLAAPVAIIFCLFSITFAYSGGTGEADNPYQIATVADWQQLMSTSSDWGECFVMTADVNLQGIPLTPVGFFGVFDGNGHIIRNAAIDSPDDNIGLFSCVSHGGQIRNLGVVDVNMTGNCNVGGLVGGNDGSSVAGSFWDVNTSGQSWSAGGEGKTTAEMQTLSTFTDAGWDFVGEIVNGTEDIWTICEGISYPKFAWQNQPPVADAGPDQTVYAWLDNRAEVTLDGSASSDSDCGELTYTWRWFDNGLKYEASGVNPVIELPVGSHRIELIVNDGSSDSEPDYVDVNVIAPLKARLNIIPFVINRSNHLKNIIAIMQLPAGVKKADVKNEPFILYPAGAEEGIESNQQHIFSWRGRVIAIALFSKDELMDIVPHNGRVALQVVGELNCGQYFFGSDTIMIINNHGLAMKGCLAK